MSNSRFLTATFVALGVVLAGQSAETAGQTTSNGLFGSRNLGSGVSAGNRTFGGSGAGQGVTQAQAGAGQLSGDERFLRQNRQPGQFVGADTTDATNSRSQSNRAGGLGLFGPGGLDQLNQLRGLNPNQQGGLGANTSRTTIRSSVRLGFEPTSMTTTESSARLQTRLGKLPQISAQAPITVTVSDGTVVLRGRVATAHERELAERVARLEPGVKKVRNEIVAPGAASPGPAEELPAPRPR